ncbi:FAD-dependent oxidoreductase [Pseudaminobacter sp. 19-2017]|uniref:FAD-dependent oxidoreductase n=1 Tax=Pseudaminobacter soli (ex Zhang et al. 2022) TaxID=2831468 RepID=A0A942E2U3_9HYPH|nr:NAD(P)-binding protein [Pseudaminobacter soli]MBS3651922.1 FAD-dependent oxidoreductase [Pseudaminobacter soli]
MNAITSAELPVAVIGAGPVGLAAAARLVERGLRPAIFEKGNRVGAAILDWGHVRVFSPWDYNVDEAARALLADEGIAAPEGDYLPTGEEIVAHYLEPLSRVPSIASGLKLGAEVTGVTRLSHDLMSSDGRVDAPFVVRYRDGTREHRLLARAVIDASGTWSCPNPMGPDGLAVTGEAEATDLIAYGIPDIAVAERDSYSGKRTLVLGSGHSAINVALALLDLQEKIPDTRVLWALRRDRIDRLLGGGLNDQLPGRGALGLAAKKAINEGRLDMLAPFVVDRVVLHGTRLKVEARLGSRPIIEKVDRIVVATGFRPDFSFLRELRLGLDPAIEAPPALAPLIDPNVHSCGTVPPHGIHELAHPESGFVIVGSKSYGRAPTFLMATGYEQVRSVVAELAGDRVAAREVRLVLPETGVCGAPASIAASSCCGGPAPTTTNACCADDAAAKAHGQDGCGCSAPVVEPAVAKSSCCQSAA